MANTYTLIASYTVSGTSTTLINFTSIPQTYTDLKLVCSLRSNRSIVSQNSQIYINGTSATNLSSKFLYGTGSAAGSATRASMADIIYANGSTATANTFSNCEVYFPNYTSTTTYKSFSADSVSENNATAAEMQIGAGLYSNNSAITSIGLEDGIYYIANSTAYLYGIKNS